MRFRIAEPWHRAQRWLCQRGEGDFSPGEGVERRGKRNGPPIPLLLRLGLYPVDSPPQGARAVAKLLAGGVIFVKSPLTQTEQAAETDAGSEPTRLLLLPQE